MDVDFLGDVRNPYAATGFLTDNFLFLTAAHNVFDRNNENEPALKVCISFGKNGPSEDSKLVTIEVRGQDFMYPFDEDGEPKYKHAMDEHDIAWINLAEYHRNQIQENVIMNWGLEDLPKKVFKICAVPESDGKLPGEYHICGNRKYFNE